MIHSDDCVQPSKRPCPVKQPMFSEGIDEHWWSGWPGAFCLKCGDDDMDEVCIGGGCECTCHAEFWAEYDKAMQPPA